MQETRAMPTDMKVLANHIYEFKKGVRQMVLFTFNRKYEHFAAQPTNPVGKLYGC